MYKYIIRWYDMVKLDSALIYFIIISYIMQCSHSSKIYLKKIVSTHEIVVGIISKIYRFSDKKNLTQTCKTTEYPFIATSHIIRIYCPGFPLFWYRSSWMVGVKMHRLITCFCVKAWVVYSRLHGYLKFNLINLYNDIIATSICTCQVWQANKLPTPFLSSKI